MPVFKPWQLGCELFQALLVESKRYGSHLLLPNVGKERCSCSTARATHAHRCGWIHVIAKWQYRSVGSEASTLGH